MTVVGNLTSVTKVAVVASQTPPATVSPRSIQEAGSALMTAPRL
jgi:hypothetical protein